MDAQENGLTLEALAHRLETLQRENAENAQRLQTLERENTELRSKVATLEGSGMRRDEQAEKRGSHTRRSTDGEAASEPEGQVVSRKALLSKAGAAAVAAVAAGTLLGSSARQAKAHDATNDITANIVSTHYIRAFPHQINADAAIDASLNSYFSAISGINAGSGYGVEGHSASGAGVYGIGLGQHEAGVKGEGWTGVWGYTEKRDYSGVYGEHKGTSGNGTTGIGKGEFGAGVLGRNDTGYGGQFEGGKAQLKLKPAATLGKPTTGTHTKGEIYMDKAGALFVCTAGDGTTVGTWKKVNMKLV